jgi:hypothetical protein
MLYTSLEFSVRNIIKQLDATIRTNAINTSSSLAGNVFFIIGLFDRKLSISLTPFSLVGAKNIFIIA